MWLAAAAAAPRSASAFGAGVLQASAVVRRANPSLDSNCLGKYYRVEAGN